MRFLGKVLSSLTSSCTKNISLLVPYLRTAKRVNKKILILSAVFVGRRRYEVKKGATMDNRKVHTIIFHKKPPFTNEDLQGFVPEGADLVNPGEDQVVIFANAKQCESFQTALLDNGADWTMCDQ